ncbi:hypothetical protein quinque_008612 [Culex quinquefasciatus]
MFVDKDVCSAPVQQAMDITAITTLPKLTQENYRVIFAKIIDTDASKFVLPTIFKFGFTCVDIDIWENGCSEGYVLIIDTKTLHIGHLPKIGLFTVKNFVYYIQEALPLRLKAVHFINMTKRYRNAVTVNRDHDYGFDPLRYIEMAERLALVEEENMRLKRDLRRSQQTVSKKTATIRELRQELKKVKAKCTVHPTNPFT